MFISEWFLSSKYEFLYPCLSYKYLFMAYKNPPAAREQVILLKMLNKGLQVSKKEVTFHYPYCHFQGKH